MRDYLVFEKDLNDGERDKDECWEHKDEEHIPVERWSVVNKTEITHAKAEPAKAEDQEITTNGRVSGREKN